MLASVASMGSEANPTPSRRRRPSGEHAKECGGAHRRSVHSQGPATDAGAWCAADRHRHEESLEGAPRAAVPPGGRLGAPRTLQDGRRPYPLPFCSELRAGGGRSPSPSFSASFRRASGMVGSDWRGWICLSAGPGRGAGPCSTTNTPEGSRGLWPVETPGLSPEGRERSSIVTLHESVHRRAQPSQREPRLPRRGQASEGAQPRPGVGPSTEEHGIPKRRRKRHGRKGLWKEDGR